MGPKFPDPAEIQKELEDMVKNKFGESIKIATSPLSPEKEKDKEESAEEIIQKNYDLKFDYKPKDIKKHLDRFVIKQDEAKKALGIAVCDHYNHVKYCLDHPEEDDHNYSKQNVLLLGPTGVGKTYLVKVIADLIGVPFVKADATRFTESGYVGANVDDLVKDLVAQADGDLNLAQYGIVYLDEGDKLATPANAGKDVGTRGVQFGLLKLMEETEVDLRGGNDVSSQLQAFMDFQKSGKVGKKTINTKHILFIVSGAFSGLDEIIKKRLGTNKIGFAANKEKRNIDEDNILQQVGTQDLINFGFEPEFVGRLPIRVGCEHLTNDDLFHILKDSEGSIILQYVKAFKAYGIDINFTESGLKEVAKLAAEEKTGARALMTVCEKVLRHYKYELPSTNVQKITVNEKMVKNPALILEEILKEARPLEDNLSFKLIDEVEKDFLNKFQMSIRFNLKAREGLIKKAEGKELKGLLLEMLDGYEHGLKLVSKNTGETSFELDESFVKSPKKALENLITKSYH